VALSGLLAGSMTDPPALAFASNICHSDAPMVSYATVYPLTMVLRILSAQILVLLYAHDFLVLVLVLELEDGSRQSVGIACF
jgi:uncharacterized transporter YbjL